MQNKNLSPLVKSFIGFLLIIFVIFLSYYFLNSQKDSITIYGRSCDQANTSASECTSWNLFKEKYYTNKFTQEVMFDGSYGPVPYKNCHVVDETNWYCDLSPNIIGYRDGKVVDESASSKMFTTEYFGILKYWWDKLF